MTSRCYYELYIYIYVCSFVIQQLVTTPIRDEGREKPKNKREKSKVNVNE